jgi:hypothetical protein
MSQRQPIDVRAKDSPAIARRSISDQWAMCV